MFKAVMALVLAVAVSAVSGVDVSYVPPVDAPITDPFRPPETPYGPGNRGLEYGTDPGVPVRASAGGTVTFAGAVAGSLYVTLSHPDGLRTTYSYLASVAVGRGLAVQQGAVVGTTGTRRFFFSVREPDGTYLDPELLFDAGPPRVWLVPEHSSPARVSDAPRSPLATVGALITALVRGGHLQAIR